MAAPTLCETPGCLQAASHYGLCWRCHGDTRSFDTAVRSGIRNDIMEGAAVADEAFKQSKEVMGAGGMEKATKLMRAAGLTVNVVSLFSRPQSEIRAMLEYAQGILSGHAAPMPLLGTGGEPTDRRGLPFSEELVRNADVPFVKRPPAGEVGHPDYDVAWLRRLGFEAELESESVVICTVELHEIVDETERLADVVQGSGRSGSITTSFKARAEQGMVRWEGRDLGAKPGQFMLPSGS